MAKFRGATEKVAAFSQFSKEMDEMHQKRQQERKQGRKEGFIRIRDEQFDVIELLDIIDVIARNASSESHEFFTNPDNKKDIIKEHCNPAAIKSTMEFYKNYCANGESEIHRMDDSEERLQGLKNGDTKTVQFLYWLKQRDKIEKEYLERVARAESNYYVRDSATPEQKQERNARLESDLEKYRINAIAKLVALGGLGLASAVCDVQWWEEQREILKNK